MHYKIGFWLEWDCFVLPELMHCGIICIMTFCIMRMLTVPSDADFWGESKSGGPNLDCSTCSWTCFSRGSHICKWKCLIWPVWPAIPKIVIGAPGVGRVTFSDLDGSTQPIQWHMSMHLGEQTWQFNVIGRPVDVGWTVRVAVARSSVGWPSLSFWNGQPIKDTESLPAALPTQLSMLLTSQAASIYININ